MFTVYALKSINKDYIYKGMTSNVDNRLMRHNSGFERTTKPYAPFKLIYVKTFPTRSEAREHEKWLKSGAGREFLNTILTRT